jgi:hypothetical protein
LGDTPVADGFEVDCDDVLRAEVAVRDLARSFADSPSLKYAIAVRELGSSELARALDEFHEQSHRTAGDLCATADDAADRLHDTATLYAEHDQATADAMAVDP